MHNACVLASGFPELIPSSHFIVVVFFPQVFEITGLLIPLEFNMPNGRHPMTTILPVFLHQFEDPMRPWLVVLKRRYNICIPPSCDSPEFSPSSHFIVVIFFPQLFKFACCFAPFELDAANGRYPMVIILPGPLHEFGGPIDPG
jgi:hypothetical protein